ncbi:MULTISPECIES: SA1362 family protein [Bacillus]|uniref:Uncharacterized protein n=2 Tax=Bacillus TaxID=1386 RepID=A0A0M4G8P0_9BACI|nr:MULTISPECIES: SA1362 family protein [Bacillus]ALC81590.1 hypothetical protein AM592_08230 [Bacillus gobiensis]MBP1080628.1 hypothetical protein [Bacillus capparidis]MED1094484.1 SA1362 family protein [Bacillus capparidis]
MNRLIQPIIGVIIGLGAIGIIYSLVTSPGQFAWSLFYIAIGACILFFVLRYFLTGRMGTDGAAYKKAAKQSARRFQDKKPKRSAKNRHSHLRSIPNPNAKPLVIRKKSKTQLTVIEGKKNKKKKRALF